MHTWFGNEARGMLTRLSSRALVLVLFVLAGCTGSGAQDHGDISGQPAKKGIARGGRIELTIWDQNVRASQNTAMTQLNKAFEQRYPNVTLRRVARTFFDLKATLQGPLPANGFPDVVQINQGWADMGDAIRRRLLVPLDDYENLYDWRARYPESLVSLNSFSRDGRRFGTGSLFGLSQEAEFVGVYYNKHKLQQLELDVPRTLPDFNRSLASARRAGETPIQFGNLDRWPAIHEFQVLQNHWAPKAYVRDLIFGRADVSFATRFNRLAGGALQDWVRKGYLSPGFNRMSYDDAWSQFTRGKGVFLITGTWVNADLEAAMGNNVGFFLFPSRSRQASPVATGGEGLAFAITTKSVHPDAAAAYIDFITNRHAASVITKAGGLPAMSIGPQNPTSSSQASIFKAWKRLNAHDGLVPYLDYATPTFYQALTAELLELTSGRSSPRRLVSDLQDNYSTFQKLR
jgi:raffinose/stachyose/melibiose transport system substrate-binding protein